MSSASSAPGRQVKDGRRPSRRRLLAYAVALGLAYAALSKLVTEITTFGVTVGASFWPGAGLTVAVLLVRPRREWPWLLLAVGIAEATMDLLAGFDPLLAPAWAVANTAEAALAAWLLTRGGRAAPNLADRGDLLRFTGAAVLLGPLIGATIGTAAAVLVAGDPWWPRLPRWWLGDGIGVLVVAPLLLVILTGQWWRPRTGALWPLALLVVASVVALGPWDFSAQIGLPFLVLPVLSVVALTLRTPGTTAGVLIVAVIVEAVTAIGEGPFAHGGAFEGLLVAQMFLAATALTALGVAALMSDLVTRDEVEATLRVQAAHDGLTGLPNRRLLFDRIDVASRRLARHHGVLALLFIDLDGFKGVNDAFGHALGDEVLVDTGTRLRSIVRDGDTVARIGGDEFVVLAESLSSVEDAHRLARRALDTLAEPRDIAGRTIAMPASVGVAVADSPLADVGEFLDSADRAMYRAKRGRSARAGDRLGVASPAGGAPGSPTVPR